MSLEKKAVILSPSNGVGGVETFCRTLQLCMKKNGWSVDIVSPPQQGVLAKIAHLVGLGAPFDGLVAGRLAKRQGHDLLVTNGLLGWNVKRGRIVNIQHGTFAASAERIDKGRSSLKWFIKRFIWGHFEQVAARRAGTIVAVSEDTKRSVEQYYKTPVDRVIENAVDTDMFRTMDRQEARGKLGLPLDKKIVLFVGRMEYAKGGDIIERMMAEIGDEAIFVFVLGNRWNMPRNNVRVFHNVPNHELPPFYAAADVFVFPSRHEGCALAVIEAMSCELPCVLSEVGHALDIKRAAALGRRVVPQGDAEAFIVTVKNLLAASEEERQIIGRAARDYVVQHNSLDGFCRAYNEIAL